MGAYPHTFPRKVTIGDQQAYGIMRLGSTHRILPTGGECDRPPLRIRWNFGHRR